MFNCISRFYLVFEYLRTILQICCHGQSVKSVYSVQSDSLWSNLVKFGCRWLHVIRFSTHFTRHHVEIHRNIFLPFTLLLGGLVLFLFFFLPCKKQTYRFSVTLFHQLYHYWNNVKKCEFYVWRAYIHNSAQQSSWGVADGGAVFPFGPPHSTWPAPLLTGTSTVDTRQDTYSKHIYTQLQAG